MGWKLVFLFVIGAASCVYSSSIIAQVVHHSYGSTRIIKVPRGGLLNAHPFAGGGSPTYIEKGVFVVVTSDKCISSAGYYPVRIHRDGKQERGYMLGTILDLAVKDCREYSKSEIRTAQELGLSIAPNNVQMEERPSKASGSMGREPQETNFSQDGVPIRFRQSQRVHQLDAVAVIGNEGSACDGQVTQSVDEAVIVEQELLGLYEVVDRNHLEAIMNEQRLAMSGLVLEEGKLAEAGCLAGAQGTVIVSKGCLAGNDVITVKLLDCSTSVMSWVATGPIADIYGVMDQVRSKLRK